MKSMIYSKTILCVLVFVCSLQIQAQHSMNLNPGVRNDSLYSEILKEKRNILVYVPASFYSSPKLLYPVVYLLDGDAHMNTVLNIIQQLSEENMNLVLPQMILVGIPNTDRMRDLTPSHVLYDPDIPDSNYVKTSGGSENFSAFLEKELIPYIQSKYPATPYRTLIGHSAGGLFCINTLLNHTRLFNSYLSIDPNLDWDNNNILNQAKETLKNKNFEGISLYLAIANQGYSDTDTYKENAASFEFARLLDAESSIGLKYSWKYYKDDNHSSIPLISVYDGLRYLYEFYNPRLPYSKFRDPNFNAESFLTEHYTKVSSKMGYTVHPPETVINWLGYLFIMERQYDKALTMMKLNTRNFTDSWNAFDSLGEIFMIQGKNQEAIKNYIKSLQLNPGNGNAKRMIEQLSK